MEDDIILTEFGAAETVPGSKLLIKIGKKDYLIDIGKGYENKEDSKSFSFDVNNLESLILSHAHADHMGEMLKLVKTGFKGKIFSTYETAGITKLQLDQDVSSVFIHNKMVKGKKYAYGPNKGKWVPFKPVIYNSEDVKKSMGLFESFKDSKPGFPYENKITISDNVNMTFYEAGHIPGSAQILLEISHEGRNINVLTACDLGRTDYKILGHPRADIPIVKFPSTSGN